MKNSPARRVALTGMLFALALLFSFVESLLAPFLGLPPGVKPGLANVVVMFCLLCQSRTQALALAVLKAGFAFLTRGPVAGMLSLAGGLFSLGVMLLLLRLRRRPGLLLLSISGALAHNLGQLALAWLLLGKAMLYYAPVLLAAGVGMGVLTSLLLRLVLPALERTGMVPPMGEYGGEKKEPGED